VQNFRTIGQVVFVWWMPENGMFPWESEVILNTVLSANALHVIIYCLMALHAITLLITRRLLELLPYLDRLS
jgi:hypothetical protein